MPIPEEITPSELLISKADIYEALKQWIIEGKLAPGEKILDTEIASHFHVSRTPVREVLQLLEMQKLVKSFPGKATVVTEIEKENIEQWYLPMTVLQKLAVKIAAEKTTSEDICILQSLNQHFETEIEHRSSIMGLLNADKAFHEYILHIADNAYISDFCETLWIHIQRLEYNFFRETTALSESVSDHEKIIEAFARRDGFSASLAMKNNWDNTVIQIQNLRMLNRI